MEQEHPFLQDNTMTAKHAYASIPASDSETTAPVVAQRNILGTEALRNLSDDAILLMKCKVVRSFSFGFLAVMLVLYLVELGYSVESVGVIFTYTLFGDAAISLALTTHADSFGRRKCLLIGSFLAIITSFIFITQTNFYVIVLAATFGVISPSGSEVGPFMAIEISSLTQVIPSNQRAKLMAWYNLFGSFACAFGALSCGLFVRLFHQSPYFEYDILTSYRITFCLYSSLHVYLMYLFLSLGDDIEVQGSAAITSSSSNPYRSFLG